MKKVLILGVASVQMDAVLQLKHMGCETFTIAMAKDGPAADVADHFEIINILAEDDVAKYIIHNNIDAVYSTGSDLAMPVACRLSEKLNLPHFVCSETAYICNHKNEMRYRLGKAKGNVPFQVMDDLQSASIEFPFILKPSDAQGQRGIFLIKSKEEFLQHFIEAKKFSREGKVILEKYINGPELSINCYMVDKKLKYLIISDRETWPEYTGLIHKHIVPSQNIDSRNDEIRSMCEEACLKMGIINGPAYFQVKLDENNVPYIIEVTPRLDGCHMWNILEKATGVNLMKLTFEHLLYGMTSELKNMRDDIQPMELVFFCQKPCSTMDRSAFNVPDDALYSFFYYETGDYVRPVNGKFDKVGYYIRNL